MPLVSIAQAMRVVLFANATAAMFGCRVVAIRITQVLSRSVFACAVRMTARAPCTSKLRRSAADIEPLNLAILVIGVVALAAVWLAAVAIKSVLKRK